MALKIVKLVHSLSADHRREVADIERAYASEIRANETRTRALADARFAEDPGKAAILAEREHTNTIAAAGTRRVRAIERSRKRTQS